MSVGSGGVLTIDSGASLSSSTNLSDQGVTNINNASQTIATLGGSGRINLNPGTILTITGGGSFAGVIADPTATVVVAGGSLIFSGNNTYVGDTDITAGTLEIAAPGSLASVNINISGGAALIVDPGGSISSTTNLTNNGTATFNDVGQTIASESGGGTLNLIGGPLTFSNGGDYLRPCQRRHYCRGRAADADLRQHHHQPFNHDRCDRHREYQRPVDQQPDNRR